MSDARSTWDPFLRRKTLIQLFLGVLFCPFVGCVAEGSSICRWDHFLGRKTLIQLSLGVLFCGSFGSTLCRATLSRQTVTILPMIESHAIRQTMTAHTRAGSG